MDDEANSAFEFGPFVLDIERRQLLRDGRAITLSGLRWKLLTYLVEQSPRAVPEDELCEQLWPDETGDRKARLKDVYNKLCKKLSADLELQIDYLDWSKGHFSVVSSVTRRFRSPEEPRIRVRSLRGWIILASLVALAALLVFVIWRAGWSHREIRNPSIAQVSVNTLIAQDGQGREIWKKEFAEGLDKDRYGDEERIRKTYVVADVDGDGQTELLFSRFTADKSVTPTLFCYSAQGKEKWRFEPGRPSVKTKSGIEYRPPYFIDSVIVLRPKNNNARVVVSSNHFYFLSGPTQLAILDGSTGTLQSEYWHTGPLPYIDHADLDGDGSDELIAAGLDYGMSGAVLRVFDPLNVNGANATVPVPHLMWDGFERSTEKKAILFMPSTAELTMRHPATRTVGLRVSGGRLYVTVLEGRDTVADRFILYELDQHLKAVNVRFSDGFGRFYDDLYKRGKLEHPLLPTGVEELKGRLLDITPRYN